jgi:hypothetical protein
MSYLFDTNVIIYNTKTPEAIIAATALVHGLAVITQNTDDFTRLGIPTPTVTMKP